MNTFIVWAMTMAVVAIIISPFLWLKYLKRKNAWAYVLASSVATIGIFLLFFFKDSLICNYFAKISADLYYAYDDAGADSLFILLPFMALISPFIFTKVIYGRIKLKSFFISLGLSFVVFIIFIGILRYYIMPKAFETLLFNL